MESWNGISMIQGQDMLPPVEMWSDALGVIWLRGYFSSTKSVDTIAVAAW